jgi:hypothetical protein
MLATGIGYSGRAALRREQCLQRARHNTFAHLLAADTATRAGTKWTGDFHVHAGKEEHRLKVLRRISGPGRDEMVGGCRE